MNNKYCIYLFLLYIGISVQTGYAQGENNHWHFGVGHHIDFNQSPPVYTANSNISTYESSVTVSDAQGNLLFYTIGCRIWDRNGNEMPGATGLKGNAANPTNPVIFGSGQESVQVLPHPAQPDRYFVFSASAIEDGLDTIYYHLVDMQLNGGLGDIVPGSKNMILYSGTAGSLSEFTTTTRGECRNFWYIVTMGQQRGYAYYAYKIDENGISATPVISTPPIGLLTFEHPLAGSTKILNKQPYAYRTSGNGLLRSQFNRATGQFINFVLVPNTEGYRFDLSPNEQMLYMTNGATLKQYNLQAPFTTIGTTATTLAWTMQNGDVRLGPDGKIYTISFGGQYVGRIEQPDVPGTACTYIPQYFTFPVQIPLLTRLGTPVLARKHADTIINQTPYRQTILCEGDSTVLQNMHQQANAYSWNTGHTSQQIKVEHSGTYWCYTYTEDCRILIDTFIVATAPSPALLGNDTNICQGQYITLEALPGQDSYLWSDGSTSSSLTVYTAGTYTLSTRSGNCIFTDTIVIDTIVPVFQIIQTDTLICIGTPTLLQAMTNMNGSIHWNTGQTGSSIYIDRAGTYVAQMVHECGQQSDSVQISDMDCNCRPLVPNAFTPNGDGLNDVFMPVFNPDCDAASYELKIYNRYGQLVYTTNRKDKGWNGTYSNTQPAEAGVYLYIISLSNRQGNTGTQLIKGDILLVR